jgi:hypothetical protein
MKKKVFLSLTVFLLVTTSFFSSVAGAISDPAGWQTIGKFNVGVSSPTGNLLSGGGNIQLEMFYSYSDYEKRVVEVWEDDGAFGDDFIKEVLLEPGEPVTIEGIKTDGTNDGAEIYLVPQGFIGQSTVSVTFRD